MVTKMIEDCQIGTQSVGPDRHKAFQGELVADKVDMSMPAVETTGDKTAWIAGM
jgi:hypothetical protein